MKKIISIFALVLAITALMSISAFAAGEFSVAEGTTLGEGVTVAASTTFDDAIDVTVPATAGADYSIVLVTGNELPTDKTTIAYINQTTAAAGATSVDFDVLPLMDNITDGTELTLYIGTNAAEEGLIAIPMIYTEETVVEPDPEEPPVVEPTYQLAEIDGDSLPATIGDALEIINFTIWETSKLDPFVEDVAALTAMAEIDGDGLPATIGDALEIINFTIWETSKLDSIYGN